MRYPLTGVGAVLVALLAIGCSDRNQPLPPGPNMRVVDPPGTTCDFRLLSQIANRYFGPAEAKIVRGLISQMQDGGAGTTTAKDRGFDVMARIATNVNAGNTNVADAAGLTNGLLVCMFTDVADLPETFPEDFTIATNPALRGAYAVRGGATDPLSAPVFSRPLTAPFSGVAPSGSNTWATILSSNPAPARVLVYGMPGSQPQTYDWRVVPRSTVFSPPAVVGLCIDADVSTTSLLHEEHVGLLPFVDAGFLNPATCSPFATQSWSMQVASRLARWGIDFLGPRPLAASGVMNPGGLGGSTGGIGSEFGPEVVNTVTLTFVVQPTDVTVNQVITPAVVVQATAIGTSTPVPNVIITLAAIDNNGVPAVLQGTLTDTTDASGNVTFSDLSETKPGGYRLTATGSVIGRPGIAVPTVSSVRFNVRP